MCAVVLGGQRLLCAPVSSLCLATHRRNLGIAAVISQPGAERLGIAETGNTLVPSWIAGAVDTEAVVACLEQGSEQRDKKADVRLDNAPVPRATAFLRHIPQWVKKGVLSKYFPAYAPELNRIGILWRFMQYAWLPLSA
jgi:hypothetical protein